jgi:hypothetical protein
VAHRIRGPVSNRSKPLPPCAEFGQNPWGSCRLFPAYVPEEMEGIDDGRTTACVEDRVVG